MPMIQDLQKGLSKHLQEMILSSGDEDQITGSRGGDTYGYGFGYGTTGQKRGVGDDTMEDEEE